MLMKLYFSIFKVILWWYKRKGLRVGKNLEVGGFGLGIDTQYPWLITIGDNVGLSTGSLILAHDDSLYYKIGYSTIGAVNIGNDVFIGAKAVILPGVSIGNNSIVAAGSVVTKPIPANTIVAGVPAVVIGTTDALIDKRKQLLKTLPKFYTKEMKNTEYKQEMYNRLKNGRGFIR